MAVFFFSLRGVPEDEAQEIRDLLASHRIAHYETPAGKWGVSMPAIWLENEAQLEAATILVREYQQKRTIQARHEYEQRKREGKAETFLDRVRRRPFESLLYLAIIVLVAYFSIKPYLAMRQ